jgi:hypothetical protein
LESAETQDSFRNAAHIRVLGYIPRTPDPLNPDGLPIGFIKDAPYEDGTPSLGITCAACHTNQINHNGIAYVVDGAPTMGDFERLLKELVSALRSTADNDAKFERFAAAVLPRGSGPDIKTALRASVRTVANQRAGYNERNLPKVEKDRFGPGRVDAFGAIFNEVSVTFLGIDRNWHPANAPVSYPCLWDAPQHDRAQWNGAAENKTSPIGEVLFGTSEVGALGRNSGEVIGVFGNVEINAHELLIPRQYSSTVNKTNLMMIENSLKKLWSPLWPQDAFGVIDANLKAKGEVLFAHNCAKCHAAIDRDAADRRIIANMSDEGTDQSLVRNFKRMANTGRLNGRRKTLLGSERFGKEEPVGVILKHVVERVILNPTLTPGTIHNALSVVHNSSSQSDAIDSLNPGYRMTATINLGDKKLIGRFDSLFAEGQKLTIGGGRFHLMDIGRDPRLDGLGDVLVDLRSLASVQAAANQLESIIAITPNPNPSDDSVQSKATLNNATAKIGYKARPLNGIWATAPYLHNGSVPNLAELLKPAAQRVKKFHVGSKEFDAVNIGFKDDPTQPEFDTSVDGNSNSGHEYGATLTPEERRQLLEYLKSL